MDWTELTCNKLTQLRYVGLDFAASVHSAPERLNNGALKKLFHRATLYARAVYAVVVCLSVCLSVTSRYCIETTGRIEHLFGMRASFHLSHTVL